MKPLRIHLYADGADEATMLARYRSGTVQGFTTNPTLLRQAGIRAYEDFVRRMVDAIPDRPISFGTCADEIEEMRADALRLAAMGPQVYVKVPVTNTAGRSTCALVRELLDEGVRVNVTAVLSERQIACVRAALRPTDDVIVSVFAGRIADTGVDPVPLMVRAVRDYADLPGTRLLWASPREVLNVYQADATGCHIITATEAVLSKLDLRGRDLDDYSLETVRMFHRDATAQGLRL